jgi:hypothetical protein
MMKLPFTDLGKKLKWRYRFPITVLLLSCIYASFVPTFLFAIWLARFLGIPWHGAVKNPSKETIFAILSLGFMSVAALSAYLAGFYILSWILKRRYGWSDDKIHKMMHDCEIPSHWLKPPKEKANAGEP